jgi:hypothetical protein
MGTKSRETISGGSVRASAERAAQARKEAGRLACQAWNARMLAFQGPAQPSPALGDALNAGYLYLEVKCLGCDTHQTVALDIVRRPKTTPIHDLERYMRCKDCSEVCGLAVGRRTGLEGRENGRAGVKPSLNARFSKLFARKRIGPTNFDASTERWHAVHSCRKHQTSIV